MVERPASFDTLPIELLFIIFDLSDDETLLNIGKACCRLNAVAIPIYLQRVGIESPEESVVLRPLHDNYVDQLSGLSVDFSLVKIKHFVCILNHRQDNPREMEDFTRLSPIAGLQRNIERVTHLISRLQSVGSVSLVFYSMGGFWSLRLPVVEDFLTALFHFVETVTLKSCESLQILHPHPIKLKPPYQFISSKPNKIGSIVVKSLKKFRGNELEGDGWKYQPVFKYHSPPLLSPAVMLHNKIRVLELHTDFLLVPPFSFWTYPFLLHSHISALSLTLPTVVSEEEFRYYIFPRIVDSLPTLTELRLAAARDEFLASAVELLPQLPLLKKVTFGATLYGQFPPPSYSQTSKALLQLPNLTTFTGYTDQAVYMLGSASSPLLTAINIIVDDSRGRPNYYTISNKLASLKGLFTGLRTRPKFEDAGYGLADSDSSSDSATELQFNMCVSNHGRAKLSPFQSATDDSKREVDFSMVSKLSLELPISSSDDTSLIQQVEYVMEWLDIFTGLTHFTLTTRQPYHDSALLKEMILSEYTNIKEFNVVDYPAVFHCHWSSAPSDIRRNINRLSHATTFGNKSIEGCACSDF